MNDAYLVHRDAILSVVERYVLFNEYIGREELAALLGIALPKKPPANPAPGLEALKQVLSPKPENIVETQKGVHDNYCVRDFPKCNCNTCQSDAADYACCSKHGRHCTTDTPCPDYIPEALHDPLP